jgi:hypothetical protein
LHRSRLFGSNEVDVTPVSDRVEPRQQVPPIVLQTIAVRERCDEDLLRQILGGVRITGLGAKKEQISFR